MSQSSLFSAHCPHCAVALKCSPQILGRWVKCPQCGKQFQVRHPDDRPPIAAPSTLFESLADGDLDPEHVPPKPSFSPPPPPQQAAFSEPPVADFVVQTKPRRPERKPQMTRQQLIFIVLAGLFVAILALLTIGYNVSTPHGPRGSMEDGLGPFGPVLGAVVLTGLLLLYVTPSIVAFVREHQNAVPILILNLCFGWTFLGWVICLAWAFSSDVRESRQTIRHLIVKVKEDD
jgi:hypothetical protein